MEYGQLNPERTIKTRGQFNHSVLGGTPFLFRQGELVVIVKTQDHEFDLRPEQALTETGGFKVGEIESILHLKQDSI